MYMNNEGVKIRLEMVWIRVRAWIRVLIQLGSIATFLFGGFAIYRAYTLEGALDPTLLGVDIPALFGLSEYDTLLYGGIVLMMIGLGFAYRWIISDSKNRVPY